MYVSQINGRADFIPHSSLGNMTPREYAENHNQPEALETEILTLETVQ
jgi:hypothetical protein